MKIGVANKETWIFLEPIYDYLAEQHEVSKFVPRRWPTRYFAPRMSHRLLRQSLKSFLEQNDVVLIEWASEWLIEASQVKATGDAAMVTRLHRYEMFTWVERINWEKVDRVILDTEAMREKLLARTDVPYEKTTVIPPVQINPEQFLTRDGAFQGNIGILANIHPRKRIYELILAFHRLVAQNPDLHLHIGGPPRPGFLDYYDAILDLIQKLRLSEHVTLHGRVEDRWAWYTQMDVFVSYSYSEGMQVAPLEAATCDCYCLSHEWTGADEIFPTAQRFLDDEGFVDCVLAYCQATSEERRAMRQPLREFIRTECSQTGLRVANVLDQAVSHQYLEAG